ncbi:MAG: pseudouridine synthase [Blastochloris sp.]|nr:pseudouridine synthase [Blastochloris sp.]
MLIAFHKPYGVLSQFTSDGSPHETLHAFAFPKNVYPLGRLDADSEGLLLLSNEAGLNTKLLKPENQHSRTYYAQVEGDPNESHLDVLRQGLKLADHDCLPCGARILTPQPDFPPRIPPIRMRKMIPSTWIELELVEGKNRQVRRMTAAIGFPTLRLIRMKIGAYPLADLPAGTWKELSFQDTQHIFSS